MISFKNDWCSYFVLIQNHVFFSLLNHDQSPDDVIYSLYLWDVQVFTCMYSTFTVTPAFCSSFISVTLLIRNRQSWVFVFRFVFHSCTSSKADRGITNERKKECEGFNLLTSVCVRERRVCVRWECSGKYAGRYCYVHG